MPGPTPVDAAEAAADAAPGPARRVCGSLLLIGAVLLLVWLHADPQVATSADGDVVLSVYPNGRGTVTVDPAANTSDAPASENQLCEGRAVENPPLACRFHYRVRGQVVTLTAAGDPLSSPPITFEGWNDDRCPAGPDPKCTLKLNDDEDFVMALFTPHNVRVKTNSSLISTPQVTVKDLPGGCEDFSSDMFCGPFALNTVVTLIAKGTDAEGPTPRWGYERCDAFEANIPEPTCTVKVNSARGLAVGFGNATLPTAIPPAFADAPLSVVRTGNGSGAVRSQSRLIDCGTSCRKKGNLADYETLVADASAGSRFAGWSGRDVCPGHSTELTCKVSFGSRVRARFDRAAGAAAPSARPPARSPARSPARPPAASPLAPQSGPFRFAARLKGKVKASGRGSRRKISFTVYVNAPAVVTARLLRGGKRVGQKKWSVKRGNARRTLKVPRRARAGKHRITVIAARGGARKSFSRNVKLRR